MISAERWYASYEVSNMARDGAKSRHNLNYWRYGELSMVSPGAQDVLTQNGIEYIETQRRIRL